MLAKAGWNYDIDYHDVSQYYTIFQIILGGIYIFTNSIYFAENMLSLQLLGVNILTCPYK